MPQLTPFQQAALEYKKHISLTANAGSGKTFVLAKRFVEIAVNEDIPLSKIVAITFTEKAAGELNKKIAQEIDHRIEVELDQKKLRILLRIRRQLTSANISTIHSFCINLLKEYSPEAGIDANFSPLNQQDANELLDLVINDFIAHNLSNSIYSSALKNVIRLLGGKNKFVTEIRKIAGSRKTINKLGEILYSQTNDKIFEYYEKNLIEFIEILFNDEINPLLDLVSILNAEVINDDPENQIAVEVQFLLDKLRNEEQNIEKLKIFSSLTEQLFTKSLTIKKRGYLKKGLEVDDRLIENLEHRIQELKSLTSISFEEKHIITLIKYAKELIEITKQILSNYDERKRKDGYLDFEDILLETKELTSKENFTELLKDKYEYIMIDEYQDTNEIQYEIFMPILNNLNKGNLFVVGDEKQSIYMFREAELQVFNRTKSDIVSRNEDGNLLLPHSFRVAPPIAHFTNELFSKLLQNPKTIYNEVQYNELICSRPKESNGKIEILLNTEDGQSESTLVAAKILSKEIDNEEYNWKEYAVLCRKRSSFSELEKTFGDLGIPYVIAGGKGFYQRQTIFDIYNYISFLLNPDDETALVGLLRSPFYLFDDELIYKIYLEEGDSLFEKLKKFNENSALVTKTLSQLEKHLTLASSIRLSSLLREIFSSCNYWGVTASKQNYEQEISNLFKLLGVARKFSLQSFKTLYDFKLFLNEAITEFEDEGQAQIADASNAVKIMTLHQAKGLEFKNVFLYNCNEKTRTDTVQSKSLEIDKTWGIITKVPIEESYFLNYASPAVADIYSFIENKKQIAEAKRLFYVGITRAVDNLFLTGTVIENKIEKNSFLGFAASGLNTDLRDDQITLESNLKFMADAENNFKMSEEPIKTVINIQRDLQTEQYLKIKKNDVSHNFTEINTRKINDHEKNEIVSATKIAIFTQCPIKYYLTYELGYTELFKLTKAFINEYDFKQGEDENLNVFADIRGQIIHKLLEEETSNEKLSDRVDELIDFHLQRIGKKKEAFKDQIITDVSRYFTSKIYEELKSKKNFKNEFEVYAKETDFYVYGIIDKLIIDNDVLTVVDYKTDNVSADNVDRKAVHYLPQLKFYSYTLHRLFKTAEQITVQLIFIKQPEKVVKYSFAKEEIMRFGKEIKSIVAKIREGKFTKNLDHCSKCHFSLNQNCVFQTKF